MITGCKKGDKPGENQGMPQEHPKVETKSKIEIKPGSIKKADGGYTVEECYTMKDKIKDKSIAVRGVVVKFNADIMSRNWIHIQDGTGKDGSNDLTVTTLGKAEVGQKVLVSGKMALDKEFGANYKYPVIMEGATVTAEK